MAEEPQQQKRDAQQGGQRGFLPHLDAERRRGRPRRPRVGAGRPGAPNRQASLFPEAGEGGTGPPDPQELDGRGQAALLAELAGAFRDEDAPDAGRDASAASSPAPGLPASGRAEEGRRRRDALARLRALARGEMADRRVTVGEVVSLWHQAGFRLRLVEFHVPGWQPEICLTPTDQTPAAALDHKVLRELHRLFSAWRRPMTHLCRRIDEACRRVHPLARMDTVLSLLEADDLDMIITDARFKEVETLAEVLRIVWEGAGRPIEFARGGDRVTGANGSVAIPERGESRDGSEEDPGP